MALNSISGSPVTGQDTNRLPAHPATGAVFAIRQAVPPNGLSPTDQKRSSNRHRRAAAARPFQERAEAKRNQHELQAFIRRQARDRILHHLKLSGRGGDVVEKDRGHDDPRNADRSKNHAVSRRRCYQHRRHLENQHGQRDGHQQPAQRRHPHPLLSTTRTKKSVSTGRAETAVDSSVLLKGS
jgi:hypothetical protein